MLVDVSGVLEPLYELADRVTVRSQPLREIGQRRTAGVLPVLGITVDQGEQVTGVALKLQLGPHGSQRNYVIAFVHSRVCPSPKGGVYQIIILSLSASLRIISLPYDAQVSRMNSSTV